MAASEKFAPATRIIANTPSHAGASGWGRPKVGTVVATKRPREGFDRGGDDRGAFGVEHSTDAGAAQSVRRQGEASALPGVAFGAFEPVAEARVG